MRKKILLKGPVLSQSGYGEHTRFALRALRLRESDVDLHILPTGWGQTGWIADNSEEREWIDSKIKETIPYLKSGGHYDISVQVTIPNEWEKIAQKDIGVTAGIETNKVSPLWLHRSNFMNKIITISEHSKKGFETIYRGVDPEKGDSIELGCNIPVEVAQYPVKTFKNTKDLDLNLKYDFNYLTVAQWGPRKNVENTIRWFIEENYDQEVGLVIKMSLKNNSVVDREYTMRRLLSCIPEVEDCKCKVYLLHGDMSEQEMHSLYQHPKIKCMISLSHGEGFGLPLFEAAYSGLPIIAPGWSGHCDFLYMPNTKNAKKNKMKCMFADVDFHIAPVPKQSLWKDVIEEDMVWCFPTEGSYKLRLRQVRKNYDKWLKRSKELQTWILKEFEKNKKTQQFCDLLLGESNEASAAGIKVFSV